MPVTDSDTPFGHAPSSAPDDSPLGNRFRETGARICEYFDVKPPLASRSNGFFRSQWVDFVEVESTFDRGTRFACAVYKPSVPAPMIVVTHGWHLSVRVPDRGAEPVFPGCLVVQIDMRGRKYSTGTSDGNGRELLDVYDGINFVKREYAPFWSGGVHFYGSSGGGGNGLGMVVKFPWLLDSCTVTAPISDYALWFAEDADGEFRDEMTEWIGGTPTDNPHAYRSRGAVNGVENIRTPLYVAHGELDRRVPVTQSRRLVGLVRDRSRYVEYCELEGVGGKDHWSGETSAQRAVRHALVGRGISSGASADLPEAGELTVLGYLVTERFQVFMRDPNALGRIGYTLRGDRADVVPLVGRMSIIT